MIQLASTVLNYLPLAIGHCTSTQRLDRTPEPTAEMDSDASVEQYDRAWQTELGLAWALGLKMIHQSGVELHEANALDIACGPGRFTSALANLFKARRTVGLDLSETMIARARSNQLESHNDSLEFVVGNALELGDFDDDEFHCVTFNQGAHHFDTQDQVTAVLAQMDRVCSPDGIVLATDLVRLSNQAVTDRYIGVTSVDYERRKLGDFKNDFANSMFAAWTPDELHRCIPNDSKRNWYHLVPHLLPTIQVIVGVPKSHRHWKQNGDTPWQQADATNYIAPHLKAKWQLLNASVAMARSLK